MTEKIHSSGAVPEHRAAAGDLELLGVWVGVAALLLAWTYPLWSQTVSLACPMRSLTGVPCPTCGGTRAVVAAARGDWKLALGFNPLIGMAGVGLLVYVPWAAAVVVGDWRRPRWSVFSRRLGAGLLLAVIVANWLYLVTVG
ncbi:MAG: DUF2752 domain-containing protein [Acidobacteriota bacterium]